MHNSTLILLFFLAINPLAHSQPYDYPTANLSTVWTNDESLTHNVSYPSGSTIRAILLRGRFGPSFAFGFYCSSQPCVSFLLSVFIVYTNSGSYITQPMLGIPQVVWSPNRSHPVRENSSLRLTSDGDLVLYDSDSSIVWSANTSGLAVAGLNLTDNGNLVLFDRNNIPVWQSFQHPTDTLLVGQSLKLGQRLTANSSTTNSTGGSLYLSVLSDGLYAFVDSNPPQMYYEFPVKGTENITYTNGSLVFSGDGSSIPLPSPPSVQYMRFEYDGRLKVYSWTDSSGWSSITNVFARSILDDCAYPTVCGAYGVCSRGQCSCPANGSTTFFQLVDARQPNLGCTPMTPLSCQSLENHRFLTLNNVSYLNYVDSRSASPSIQTEAACQLACLTNCSCKAAFFQYAGDSLQGSCYLHSQLFSMMNNQPDVTHYNSSAYIKVQVTPETPSATTPFPPPSGKGSSNLGIILGSVFGGLVLVSLVCIVLVVWRKKMATELEDDDLFDKVPGMPARFLFQELRIATDNFSMKLGEGGFGSVFKGELEDGTKVAVKRLDGIGQGKKEFLAEVQTIGSIHHNKLVRLVGFCAEKSYRLLVYEYMPNGSLDKWIFHASEADALDWSIRCRIISDIAKGLAYLHEECRQRIAHLDIKPQNILLDEKFNAKISDFGLSKLIDREQSQVMTKMRGTPGYLAPEWLTSIITEKVDIYSFGVVVMELVCGRKNLDSSQPEESIHLIRKLQKFIEEDKLETLVDSSSSDMQLHKNEAVEIIRLAMWCLQGDSSKRPLMSDVVKVLEGSMIVEHELDFNFFSATPPVAPNGKQWSDSVPLIESVLSGPR